MLSWKKLGLVVDVPALHNRPKWFAAFAQAPNSVLYDDFIRMYFSCRPQPDSHGQYVSYSSYVDLDRSTLKMLRLAHTPILPLGGLGEFDEFGIYPVSAIRHEGKIHAYYGGWTRCESVPFNVAIGYATSADGITFEKQGNGPVLGHSLEEPFVVASPKIRRYDNRWWLTYIAGTKWFMHEGRAEIIYKLRMAHSPDGIHWTRLKKNIIADRLGEDEAQACGDIIFKNGIYHMFFCYRQATNFRFAKDRTYRIGYARSTDMIHWQRQDEKIGFDISPDGWDSDMVAYPHVIEVDGKIYMFYLGNEVGRRGFGVAELQGELR